jgi:hypothetical protein
MCPSSRPTRADILIFQISGQLAGSPGRVRALLFDERRDAAPGGQRTGQDNREDGTAFGRNRTHQAGCGIVMPPCVRAHRT